MRLSANTRHEGSNPPISVLDDFSSKKPVKPLFYGLFSFLTNSHGFFRMQIQVIAGKKNSELLCSVLCFSKKSPILLLRLSGRKLGHGDFLSRVDILWTVR